MNGLFLLGVLMGMIAALMLNIGKGIQKQKVHVFLHGRKMFASPHRKDLGGWLVGLMLTAAAAVPFSFGMKFTQSPSTISAMTGVGLIGLTLYEIRVIGEKITVRDAWGIGLVVLGTSVIAYAGSGKETALRIFDDVLLIRTVAIVVTFALLTCVAAIRFRRIHGVAFGATAGFLLGLALFFADAALVRSNGSLWSQFSNPYPYIAVLFAVLTTITTQLGFLRGRALEVVPALNSSAILTPLFFEASIYKVVPQAFGLVVIAVILVGVVLISMGAVARVSA